MSVALAPVMQFCNTTYTLCISVYYAQSFGVNGDYNLVTFPDFIHHKGHKRLITCDIDNTVPGKTTENTKL